MGGGGIRLVDCWKSSRLERFTPHGSTKDLAGSMLVKV